MSRTSPGQKIPDERKIICVCVFDLPSQGTINLFIAPNFKNYLYPLVLSW